jgi:hypothetical protein
MKRNIQKRWENACSLLCNLDSGEISGYSEWLSEWMEPFLSIECDSCGSDVMLAGDYQPNCRASHMDEVVMNAVPDSVSGTPPWRMDDLLNGAGFFSYCGSICQGRTSDAVDCTGIENCISMLGCHTCNSSEGLAYCSHARECRDLFGCVMIGESEYCIRCASSWRAKRCLESSYVIESSDVLFSHHMQGCSDCMFCFNLKGKSNCIANIQLGRDEYARAKEKLLSELGEFFRRDARLPSHMDFPPKSNGVPGEAISRNDDELKPNNKIEESFAKTTNLLFGRNVGQLHLLRRYLVRHVQKIRYSIGQENQRVSSCGMKFDRFLCSGNRIVGLKEFGSLSFLRPEPDSFFAADLSLGSIRDFLRPVAYFCPEEENLSEDVVGCSNVHGARHCYSSAKVYFSKYAAFCFWPRDCQYVFGCSGIRNSSFCINCYNSVRLSRCFEADTSTGCSGSYFIHNCENVHDSMFCFNAKNLRYAVLNKVVGKEAFDRFKKELFDDLSANLESGYDYHHDIFSIVTKKHL